MGQPGMLRRAWRKARFQSRRAITDARIRLEEWQAHRRYERETARRTAEILGRLRNERHLLLNVGASGHHIPGWISVDVRPDERGIRLDAAKAWPLPDACARAVRSEHMIEHLSYQEARVYLGEAFRVLEPGGLCRTVTPDLEAIARSYLERDPEILAVHREHGYDAPTWAHFLNNYMHLWGHRFLFDQDGLASLLVEAGFVEIERASFGRSAHAILIGTDSHDMGPLNEIVLCVDAVKPGR